jgi:transcriptional repressor NrdR
MRCPYCKADDDRVANSRTNSDGTCVKRRRECARCGRRYTTYERVEERPLRVIKKDGNRENFTRKKIVDGLVKACYKRPPSMDQINAVVDEIERELNERFETEVPSKEIGELVMTCLRDLDQVAFIRFASVYREFKDVSDFVEQAGMVLRETREGGGEERLQSAATPGEQQGRPDADPPVVRSDESSCEG